jgi:hypothetical protein
MRNAPVTPLFSKTESSSLSSSVESLQFPKRTVQTGRQADWETEAPGLRQYNCCGVEEPPGEASLDEEKANEE